MAGQIVAYRRVSTEDQNLERQDLGDDVDRVFEEKISGKDRERPQLAEMVKYVREGDLVRVWSMDRLARSLMDLIGLIKEITDKGASVKFVKENLTFEPGESDPFATLQMQILGAVAEFERRIIKQRQAEGIKKAKKKGVYKGRSKALSPEKVKEARDRITFGVPKAQVARELNVSRQTLYSALTEFEKQQAKSIADRLAEQDAEQIKGQTSVPITLPKEAK